MNALSEAKINAPKIDIHLGNENDDFVMRISDNGPGFPNVDLGKLFEPYMTTRDSGTGLGLSIVQKIIDDHSGQIELANQLSATGDVMGAMVTVKLPIDRSADT